MNYKKLARFTKATLDVMFWLGIAIVLALPWIFKWGGNFYPNLKNYYWFHVALFAVDGALALFILREISAMLVTVLNDNCFVRRNVTSLRRMGWAAAAITVVTALRFIIVFTPANAVIVIVFFIASQFSFVVAGVFDKAVSYKDENDLTI